MASLIAVYNSESLVDQVFQYYLSDRLTRSVEAQPRCRSEEDRVQAIDNARGVDYTGIASKTW